MLLKRTIAYALTCIVLPNCLCNAAATAHIKSLTVRRSDPLYEILRSPKSLGRDSSSVTEEVSVQHPEPQPPLRPLELDVLSEDDKERMGVLVYYPYPEAPDAMQNKQNYLESRVDDPPFEAPDVSPSALEYFLVKKATSREGGAENLGLDIRSRLGETTLQKVMHKRDPAIAKPYQKTLVVSSSSSVKKDLSADTRSTRRRDRRSPTNLLAPGGSSGRGGDDDTDDKALIRPPVLKREKRYSKARNELAATTDESDPVPVGGNTEVASARQFSIGIGGIVNTITFGFFPRLLTALSNPAIIVMLLILNGWFAYATFSGFLFNPGIIINPNGDGGGGGSSSSSSSSGGSSSSSSGISVIGASVSGDSPIEVAPPTVTGDSPIPVLTGDEASILDGPVGATSGTDGAPSGGGDTSGGDTSGGGGTSGGDTPPEVDTSEISPPEVPQVDPPGVPGVETIPTEGAGTADNLLPALPVIPPVAPDGVAVIRPSTTDKEYGQVTGASTQGETTEGSHETLLIDGQVWQIVSNISQASFNPDSSTGGDNAGESILPLPVPRPTTSEGAVPISWIGTTDGSVLIGEGDNIGNTEQPEPTVAPSYPVLHACLVLGGDVPSCVAQAELYGQLLYEHTINALQKPSPEDATEQSHLTPEMVDKITEGSLLGVEKNQFILSNFPHASFLQPAGQEPIKGDVIESGELPSPEPQHKPLIQQILSQIQVAQASTPYVELMQTTIKNKTLVAGHIQGVDGQNERPTPSAVLSQESSELGVSHTPVKDPNKEDHIVSPVDDDPSTTPDSFQTHSPILTIQEKPPNINIITELHPHAQLVTELPPDDDDLLIANEHPHAVVVENDPPNAEVIQTLYPPDHLLDVILTHHDQPLSKSEADSSKDKKSRAARMHHSWRHG